ncbi:hypothetical protein [Xanthomonas phaseoli]|uniref:Uncharacterized protein n=3 Tax=Xanthomonas TaxID=338 RepID=A0A8I1XHF8_XANMN|nr:hypothetical protein [Xanthomonas phaseoli]RWU15684.1 hypothetical protein XANMN_16295 [Xanthomonas phaseoli pv. manihotis str. CIO151]KUF20977.1 hypothetical protein AO826_16190 [Xanthomonas phaseoli pv. manihotis]MBO9719872.1 hypothetical protein [Xanthomonas phaseoli pv. manihotis]MBO9757773.1 hypothetical protein [Xanthomonas phaseoli pv. manihotis]MBO9758971.1 hypothetical protein [Xanthomonas phaseoli pv. manihotis]
MLEEEVVSAVAIGNLKAISEQPAMLSNLAYSNVLASNNLGQQNAVSNQQAVTELGIPVVAKATNSLSNIGPLEARSAVDVLTSNELAQTITDLKATVSAFLVTSGAKLPDGWWQRLMLLLEMNLSVDSQHRLVIPKQGQAIFFPGTYAKEDIQISLDSSGVTIKTSSSRR